MTINETNEELKRNIASQITRATAGLSDNSPNVDEVTKAQVDRMKQRLEQVESAIERESQATNTKLKQVKEIIDNQNENKLNDQRRLLEK